LAYLTTKITRIFEYPSFISDKKPAANQIMLQNLIFRKFSKSQIKANTDKEAETIATE